jgi:hypothetical protein
MVLVVALMSLMVCTDVVEVVANPIIWLLSKDY